MELAEPPGGGVTGCGSMMLTPVGVLPTQAVENEIGALNSPTEFTTTFADVLSPCVVEMVEDDGVMVKSGIADTGTRTAGTPTTFTVTSVEWVIPRPEAVIRSE